MVMARSRARGLGRRFNAGGGKAKAAAWTTRLKKKRAAKAAAAVDVLVACRGIQAGAVCEGCVVGPE